MDNPTTSLSKVMKHTTNRELKTLGVAFMLLCLGLPHRAEAKSVTVSEAVVQALNTNPEIKAKFHAFRDVYEEQHVAYGGVICPRLMPRQV